MSSASERKLISTLDPLFVLMHLYQKYTKILPNTDHLIDLLGDRHSEVKVGAIALKPFDPKISNVRINTNVGDPNLPSELNIRFTDAKIALPDCIQHWGNFTLYFYPDTMTSVVSFEHFRSIYLQAIQFPLRGKYTQMPDGNFQYIDKVNFDRVQVNQEDLLFRNCTLVFRNPSNL